MTNITNTTTAKHGVFTYPAKDMYIGRSLEVYGQYCESELTIFGQLVRPGDIVVDAGANIGAYSVPLSKRVGDKGAVYAFEPQPYLCSLLSSNLIANECHNARAFSVALGAEAGTVAIPNFNYAAQNNFGGVQLKEDYEGAGEGRGVVNMPVTRLDDILDIPRLRLIKADVEGAEIPLLRGAAGLIERFSPALYLECDKPDEAEPLLNEIKQLGYHGYWHVSYLFDPANHRGVSEDIFGNLVCVNLLATPQPIEAKGLPAATGPETHPKRVK
jgi:FkbM family methyltransferase